MYALAEKKQDVLSLELVFVYLRNNGIKYHTGSYTEYERAKKLFDLDLDAEEWQDVCRWIADYCGV